MTGTYKIPFCGIARQYANIRSEILDVTDKVYASGQVLDGPYTLLFEQTIAKMTERKHAITVNSCTQALIFSLRSLDHYGLDRPIDNVLIPAQSFAATVNSVIEAGFNPVFCDVDPRTGLMDIGKIPVSVDEIDAIVHVNLFGNVIDYAKLKVWQEMFAHRQIPIIEDAAQSFGAYYRGYPSGDLGDISCLSFDPTKNLPNYGSGGMILTDHWELADACLDFRNNGKHSDHVMSGTNSRMSEADCAQMLVKLKYFNDWQARRKLIAEYYTEELDGIVGVPEVAPEVEHAWHKYVIHHERRNNIKLGLEEEGIETKIHYMPGLHLETVSFAFNSLSNTGVLEGAEQFSRTCLSLPIYPELTDSEVEQVVETIRHSIY